MWWRERCRRLVVINWRTNATGVAMILGGIADILLQISTQAYDGNRLFTDIMAIGSGVGFFAAKDAKST